MHDGISRRISTESMRQEISFSPPTAGSRQLPSDMRKKAAGYAKTVSFESPREDTFSREIRRLYAPRMWKSGMDWRGLNMAIAKAM